MSMAVLIVGAGPAGLAVATCLRARRIAYTVIDRGSSIGDSWAVCYDRLHLHTPRVQSGLPGLPIPRRFGRWVARDDMVCYLRAYARPHRIQPVFGVELRRLDRCDGRWIATTSGREIVADHGVVASGYNRVPSLPPWDGRAAFDGQLLHASHYRNPAPYVDKSVLIVGAATPARRSPRTSPKAVRATSTLRSGPRPTSSPGRSARSQPRCSASRRTMRLPSSSTRSTPRSNAGSSATSPRTGCQHHPPESSPSTSHRGDPHHRRRIRRTAARGPDLGRRSS